MKKTTKRLQLNRETLKNTQLERVGGGSLGYHCQTFLTNCQIQVSAFTQCPQGCLIKM